MKTFKEFLNLTESTKPKWNGKDYLDNSRNIFLSFNEFEKLPIDFTDADSDSFNNFYCSDTGLTSLIGSPKIVSKTFKCSNNPLVSLEGAPKEVKGNFNIRNCKELFNISSIVNIKIGGNIYYDGIGLDRPINTILNKYKNRPQDRFKLVKELQKINPKFR